MLLSRLQFFNRSKRIMSGGLGHTDKINGFDSEPKTEDTLILLTTQTQSPSHHHHHHHYYYRHFYSRSFILNYKFSESKCHTIIIILFIALSLLLTLSFTFLSLFRGQYQHDTCQLTQCFHCRFHHSHKCLQISKHLYQRYLASSSPTIHRHRKFISNIV